MLFFYRVSKMESGWDNTPRFDFPNRIDWCYAVDLNGYMSLFYGAMAKISQRIGLAEQASGYLSKKEALEAEIERRLFDEARGFYCDYNRVLHGFSGRLSPASFLPLFTCAASPEHAAAMAQLARSPRSFYPGLPTIAYCDRAYRPQKYWRGPTWLNTAYFAILGLDHYDYRPLALELTETILNWCAENTDAIYEYYDSRSGKGLGAKNFGWSAVFIIELVLYRYAARERGSDMILFVSQGNDPGLEILEAIRSKSAGEPLELRFAPGDYFFTPEHAFLRDIYITNATTVREGEPPTRQIGILIENTEDVTLTGDHTTFWFDGRMSELVIRSCKRVKIQGLTFNFVHPSVFEFDVIKKTAWALDIRPVEHCVFTLERGKLTLPFDGIPGQTIMQIRDELRGVTERVGALSRSRGSVFSRQLSAKPLPDGCLRIMLPFSAFRAGARYQFSNPFRDGVGVLIDRSEEVTLTGCTVRYLHILGITAQLSRDISILDCDFLPDEARGITTCAAADMIHACMCMGLVEVRRCRFEGARDDVINVHGVHFKILRAEGNVVEAAFCQRETYGFLAFDQGDTIEFVDPASLAKLGEANVIRAELLDRKRTRLTLDRPALPHARGLALENITKTCDVTIDGIDCRHIPTRGVLVTTRGKVEITNSSFHSLPMANILIADDARGWFESGRVRDVRIERNHFELCGAYSVDIFPETRGRVRTPIHNNIRVTDNEFLLSGRKIARVKDTAGFVFQRNRLKGKYRGHIRLVNCKDARLDDRNLL